MRFNNFVENKTPKEGDLQVWHIPQVPMKSFEVAVSSPIEGKRVMEILAAYDLFQLAYDVKPDYSNAQGLNVFEDGEWVTWYDADGWDIDQLVVKDGQLVYDEDGD